MDDARQLLMEALDAPDPARAIHDLAQTFRSQGMGQVAMYRLYSEQHQRLSDDDPRCDAIEETMDLIWGGGWAKGRALFDDELSNERLADG